MPEPLERARIQHLTAEAWTAIAQDLDAFVTRFVNTVIVRGALPERERDEAIQELRRVVRETCDRHLPLRPRVDPLGMQQLLREAYDLLMNHETRVDLKDWLRAVKPFVRS